MPIFFPVTIMSAVIRTPTLVPQASGTVIGNMTGGSGSAFDGNNSQPNGVAPTGGGATKPYLGKSWSSPKIMQQVQVWGASDIGYVNTAGQSTTINFFGKATTPANGGDGTLLATVTFNNVNGANMMTLTSTDQTTSWSYNWVEIQPDGFNSWFAEIVFYEML